MATFDLNWATTTFYGGTQPDSGNSADGRFFTQQIVSTQPSYVENADGTLKKYTSTTIVRRSSRGLAIANDRTNRLIQSRDLTNAAWTKTNVTVLKTQTGRDGVANSASQVTVTATDGTVSQAITAASVAQTGYVDIKRISGSGTCSMSIDGGATYTVLDLSKPINNGICRPKIPRQTLANPTVVLKFSTSGDVWFVDLVELSDSSADLECEPIPTTTAAVKGWRDRAAAYITDGSPLAFWLRDQTTQVIYLEYAQRQDGALIASDGDTNISSNAASGLSAGFSTANAPNFSPDARLNVINKAMFVRTPSFKKLCLNGGAIATSTGYTPDGTGTHYDIGTNGAGALSLQGMIKRCWFGTIVPSDAVMQAFTT
ncbi:hypothetical protein NKJ71_13805 [Mesorhizobium sp. M0050]|uniref:phage head spike fiber domain-containing protein n=1 Tax=Mesorhizobium sp. M0050 TaxID=2956861 RepID=UPI0033356AAE